MSGGELIERDAELAALDAAVERARTGGVVVAIEGPAGIGKSRLVDAVRDRAADGFDVLLARGGLLEQDIAFGVVRALFERRVALAPGGERAELLAGPAGRAAHVLGFEADSGAQATAGEAWGTLHGLFWLVANLAERRPLLLAVDDLHWADRSSVEFLCFLARRIEGLPVLVVAAARDDEARHNQVTLSEFAAHSETIRPAPLSASGVRELVEATVAPGASRELVEACCASTGGNPFYLRELLAAVAPHGSDPRAISIDVVQGTVPATVARSILLRLGRLEEPAPRLAVAAALLDDAATLHQAGALTGITDAEAEGAADALVGASILADVQPLRFEHPIVRAAIADDCPPAQRAAVHRRAAQLLRDEGAPVERIVPHLLKSPPSANGWAAETLRQAATAATVRGVPDVAVRLLRRALEEPRAADNAGLLVELSAAELAAGAYADSAATATRAIAAAQDPARRARIRVLQATGLLSVEGAPPALRCLEAGLAEAGQAADSQLALLLEGELATQAAFADIPHPVSQRLARHRELVGDTHAERVMLSLVAWEALRSDEPVAAVRELALRALAGGRLVAEGSLQTMAYYAATVALIEAEAYDDARAAIADGMANVRARGSEYGFAGVCWMRGMLATRTADLAAAEADERTCAERAVPTMVGIGASSLALVLLEQGDIEGAHRELERAGLLRDDRPLYLWGPYVRGLVRLAQGRAADALGDFEDVARHTTEVGGVAAGLPCQAHAALALHALGQQEEAQRVACEQLERAQRRGAPRMLGIALRACGLVSSGSARIAHLSDAVDALETSQAKLDLARARCDLGVALLRTGKRRSGRTLLERSHDTARLCGARGLAKATHEELIVAGARPRRLMFSGVEALTAAERRVAEMAADGLTNREIAETLFVTPKTVENQLGRAYAKLDVSSRKALGAALSGGPNG